MQTLSAEAVQQLRKEGDAAYLKKDLAVARDKYSAAGKAWQAHGDASKAAECWSLTAATHLALGQPFEAIVAGECGLRQNPRNWQCVLHSAQALQAVGLVNVAKDRLSGAIKMDLSAGRKALKDALRGTEMRLAVINQGDGAVLVEEIKRMGMWIDEMEGGYWVQTVGELSRTAEGRAELVEKGFLSKQNQHLPSNADVARRASHTALRYRMNKKLIRALAAAGLVLGVCDVCALPRTLSDPSAVELLTEAAMAILARDRIVVIDGAFTDSVMTQVKSEMKALRELKALKNDSNDVCNPLQEAVYKPFSHCDGCAEFGKLCPATFEVSRRLGGIPHILEDNLGLRLAVPQSVMIACYPPRASYKMHLDSYALQGVTEDIPRKVTLLVYCNVGWTPAIGGKLRCWAPFDQGQGAATEIEPVAGRIVAFMSEEIWHAVTEASQDRYALTLWVQDRDRSNLDSSRTLAS